MTPPRLDIVIPVYNEGANILRTLQSIARAVATPKRVLICGSFVFSRRPRQRNELQVAWRW
jgi:GT2 family glycosyltransferase